MKIRGIYKFTFYSGKLKLEFIKDRDVYINYKIERV